MKITVYPQTKHCVVLTKIRVVLTKKVTSLRNGGAVSKQTSAEYRFLTLFQGTPWKSASLLYLFEQYSTVRVKSE